MYKIIQLIIKYVKLTIYNELLAIVKENKASAQLHITNEGSDMSNNYYGGEVRAYSEIAYVLQTAIRCLKEGSDK